MLTTLLRGLRRLLLAAVLAAPGVAAAQGSDATFTNEQLDQMLAPIALYPDSLLSQVLMAATYPDQYQKAVAWAKAHPDAKGEDAVKLVENEDWDPSVQSLVAFPEVLITLGEKPDYVQNLGDAFLASPEDVMNAVQRLRAAAQKAGNLKSNEQVKVSTEPLESPPPTTSVVSSAPVVTQTIIIEPAQPQVVYVPYYNPTVVYGPWWYPSYPPYYYPYPPGYWWTRPVAVGVAWGVGIGVTNALWGGFNWGRHDVNINVNRYNNINVNRRLEVNGNRASWHHDPRQRTTPYRGGDATRQNLERRYDAGSRQDYRGRDYNRDASRQRAQQAMERGGVSADRGGARDRAQAISRDQANRPGAGAGDQMQRPGSGANDRTQSFDRDRARASAQSVDRAAARDRSQNFDRDNALRGANTRDARQQIDRGNASRQAAQSRPQPQMNRASPPASRPQPQMNRASPQMNRGGGGGGGGRPGGGGGGAGGGRGAVRR